jgi:RND family efflux transporter MFP subunit
MRRLLVAVLGVALLALSGGARPDDVPVVPVVLPVTRQVTETIDLTGRTEAANSVEIRARVTGFVESIRFKEGSTVKQGDLLYTIDPRPYAAEVAKAEANVAQAVARLRLCVQNFERAKALLEKGGISKDEFDKITAERDEAQAVVAAARASLDVAKLNLDFTKVTAPIVGRTGRCLLDVGNLAKADETILTTIVSEKPIFVYFEIDERTMLTLRQGARDVKGKDQTQVLVFVGLANETGYPRQGKLDFVDNRVDPKTGTLRMRAVLENADGLMVPGLFVRVRVPLGPPAKALLVPDSAVMSDGGKKFVFVVNDRDAVATRPVVLGSRHENLVVIKEGLTEKERVIVGRLKDIRAGLLVKPELQEPKPNE